MQDAQKVALTVDIWSDRRQHSYLGVTAHSFVDCVSRSALLTFSDFKGRHTGSHIAAALDKSIKDNDLLNKVPFIVCDNASNMVNAFAVLSNLCKTADHSSVELEEDDILADAFTQFAGGVDDQDLWADLSEQQMSDVESTLTEICPSRLSCFAHSMALIVKDGTTNLHGIGSTCYGKML